MASIRNLKYDINLTTGELISECMAFRLSHESFTDADLYNMLENILKIRNESISRLNNRDGKNNSKLVKQSISSIKQYYKTAISELDKLQSFK